MKPNLRCSLVLMVRAALFLQLHPCSAVPAALLLQCRPCSSIPAAPSLQCHPCSTILAVPSLQHCSCSAIPAALFLQRRSHRSLAFNATLRVTRVTSNLPRNKTSLLSQQCRPLSTVCFDLKIWFCELQHDLEFERDKNLCCC